MGIRRDRGSVYVKSEFAANFVQGTARFWVQPLAESRVAAGPLVGAESRPLGTYRKFNIPYQFGQNVMTREGPSWEMQGGPKFTSG